MNLPVSSHAPELQDDDEFSLIDLLLVVAENFWLLLIGAVIGAAVGFIVSGWLQPTYLSKAVIKGKHAFVVGAQELAMFKSVDVTQLATSAATLNAAAQNLQQQGFSAEANQLKEQASSGVGPVKVIPARNSTTFNLEATAASAQAAQKVLQAVIGSMLVHARPQGEALAELQAALRRDADMLKISRTVEASLAQQIANAGQIDPNLAGVYANVIGAINALSSSVAEHQALLQGLPADAVLVPPSLNNQPVKPQPVLVATLSGLAACLVLLLWVFLRQSWRNAQADPRTFEKMQRIRQAFLARRRAT